MPPKTITIEPERYEHTVYAARIRVETRSKQNNTAPTKKMNTRNWEEEKILTGNIETAFLKATLAYSGLKRRWRRCKGIEIALHLASDGTKGIQLPEDLASPVCGVVSL